MDMASPSNKNANYPMKVIIVNISNASSDIKNVIQGNDACQTIYVVKRRAVMETLQQLCSPHTTVLFSEDCLDRPTLEKVDDVAYRLIKSWYCQPILTDALNFKAVPLGVLIETHLAHIVPFVLKDMQLLSWSIVHFKPRDLVVVCEPREYDYWLALLNAIPCPDDCLISKSVVTSQPDKSIPLRAKPSQPSLRHRLLAPLGVLISRLIFRFHVRRALDGRQPILVRRDNTTASTAVALEKREDEPVVHFDERITPWLAKLHFFGVRKGQLNYAFSLHSDSGSQTNKRITRAHKAWKQARRDSDFQRLFNFNGIPLWDVMEPVLSKVMNDLVPTYLKMVSSIYRGLEALRPRIVVLNLDSSPFERALCLVAHQKDIPTIVVQHGIQAELRGGLGTIYSDVLAVWGNAHRRRYKAQMNSTKKLVVTGNPDFDRFINLMNQDWCAIRRQVCSTLKLNPNKKVVLLALRTNTPDYWFSAFRYADAEVFLFDQTLRAVQELEDVQILVKLHPGDRHQDIYEAKLKESGIDGTTVIVRSFPLDNALITCDAVVTHGSTVALEAMILSKPVVIANFTQREDLIPYAQEGPAQSVCTPALLTDVLRKTLFNNPEISDRENKRLKFIRDYAYQIDGLATQRVVDLIVRTETNKKNSTTASLQTPLH
jgi:hypothetical protein